MNLNASSAHREQAADGLHRRREALAAARCPDDHRSGPLTAMPAGSFQNRHGRLLRSVRRCCAPVRLGPPVDRSRLALHGAHNGPQSHSAIADGFRLRLTKSDERSSSPDVHNDSSRCRSCARVLDVRRANVSTARLIASRRRRRYPATWRPACRIGWSTTGRASGCLGAPDLGDCAGGLQLDDAVPVQAEFQQDLVGLLGEAGCRSGAAARSTSNCTGLATSSSSPACTMYSLARTWASSAACRVSCTGAHGPASVAKRSLHSGRVRVRDRLARGSRRPPAVCSAIDSAVANRGSSTRSSTVDVPADVGPELRRLHHDEARCSGRPWSR